MDAKGRRAGYRDAERRGHRLTKGHENQNAKIKNQNDRENSKLGNAKRIIFCILNYILIFDI